MKQKSIKTVGKAIAALAMTAALLPGQGALAQSPAPQGVNLFTNPGHEHPGAYFGGRGELNVSWNWVPFWEEPPPGTDLRDQNYRTPEFRPTFGRDYPYRVNSGGGGDHWFNFFALNRAAGVMQVVEGLTPGQSVRYTSWVSLWSSNDNDPAIPPSSSRDGNMQIRACVLQDGGPRNLVSKELVCSPWAQPYDKWYQISVDATAKNNKVLAFVQSRASVTVQHNDAFVDDSCFEVLSGPGASGICLGQAFVPTGTSNGVKQQSKPIPPAPVAANEQQVGSAYVNLPGFPSSGSNPPGTVTASTTPAAATASPVTTATTVAAPATAAGAAPQVSSYATYDEYLTAYYAYIGSAKPATSTASATATAAPAASASAGAATTSNVQAGLNIRSQPSISAPIQGVLQYGVSANVTGKSADGLWFEIKTANGTGYVYASLTTPNDAAKTAPVLK